MDATTTKIVRQAYADIQAAEQKIKACGNVLRSVLERAENPSPARKSSYKEQFRTTGKIKKI